MISLCIAENPLAYIAITGYKPSYSDGIKGCCMYGDFIFIMRKDSMYVEIHDSTTLKHLKSVKVPGANSDEIISGISCGSGKRVYVAMHSSRKNNAGYHIGWKFRFLVIQVNGSFFIDVTKLILCLIIIMNLFIVTFSTGAFNCHYETTLREKENICFRM